MTIRRKGRINGREGIIMEGFDNIKVNCYSGYTYAERPASFWWEGIEYEVKEIEKEWLEPGERHFQVHTVDNKLFQLCYNETDDYWSLIVPVGD